MTTFLDYFEAMGHAVRVVVISKTGKESRVVTLQKAAMITGVSCGDLMEEMRVTQTYETKHHQVRFSPFDNGPEHMPKRT